MTGGMTGLRTWSAYLRVITHSAEMAFRSNMSDSFVLFGILVQPIIIALMAFWMLGDKGGWVGKAQAKFSELELKNGWPVQASGTLDLVDVTGPVSQPNNIGAYRLKFPAPSSGNDGLLGTLESQPDAALDVMGTLKFAADRSYTLDTQVAARPNAPKNLVNLLQYLGAPDAQGRRPFSVSGTL